MKRECGDCQLCCKLLPVPQADDKKAGQKCKFQRHHKGCTVYRTDRMPSACSLWHCRWLLNDECGDVPRPDRGHYVIDMLPDQIHVSDNATGEAQELICIQVWIDPDFPEALHDEALMRFIQRKAEQGFPTLARFDARRAVGIFAPSISSDGEWHFISDTAISNDVGLWSAQK
jgi:hypothetical protein